MANAKILKRTLHGEQGIENVSNIGKSTIQNGDVEPCPVTKKSRIRKLKRERVHINQVRSDENHKRDILLQFYHSCLCFRSFRSRFLKLGRSRLSSERVLYFGISLSWVFIHFYLRTTGRAYFDYFHSVGTAKRFGFQL